jgi:hypothetical protein
MVATETVRRELAARGFERVVLWTREVDITLFRPDCPAGAGSAAACIPLPSGGGKNLPKFLELDLPGSKLVVGDGHLLLEMKPRYPGWSTSPVAKKARHWCATRSPKALARVCKWVLPDEP